MSQVAIIRLGEVGGILARDLTAPNLARYVISRALIHGKRRAEEMREVARSVADTGLEPLLSRAIAECQDWAWPRGAEYETCRTSTRCWAR